MVLVCAFCHDFIDFIGLVFDNFDVIGKIWICENMMLFDTWGTYYDGILIVSVGELVDVLLKCLILFVRNFVDWFLVYAVGCFMEYFD